MNIIEILLTNLINQSDRFSRIDIGQIHRNLWGLKIEFLTIIKAK